MTIVKTVLLLATLLLSALASSEQVQVQVQDDSKQCDVDMVEYLNLQNNLESCLQSSNDKTSNLTTELETTKRNTELLQIEFETMKSSLQQALADSSRLSTALEASKKVTGSLQATIDQLESQGSATVDKLQKDMAVIESRAKKCKEDLSIVQGEHITAKQALKALRDKTVLTKASHDQKTKNLRSEIKDLDADLKKQKISSKKIQDKQKDDREKISKLESELRRMHVASQRTYVNTTLMVEDTIKLISRSFDKSLDLADGAMVHPKTRQAKAWVAQKTSPIVSVGKSIYGAHLASRVDAIQKKLSEIDAVEGVRLTAISMLKQIATAGLNYIEITRDEKERRRPGRFLGIVMRNLEYAKKNSEEAVHKTVAFVFGLVVLRIAVAVFFLICHLLLRLFGSKSKATKPKIKTE